MTEVISLTCNWGYVTCVDGTVVEIDDEDLMAALEEPDWAKLKELLVQAEKWMLFDPECNPLHLEPVTLLHNMLFAEFDNEDEKLREMIFRFQHMLRFSRSEDEKLNQRIGKLIEPYRVA
jgi:hypothetical protein